MNSGDADRGSFPLPGADEERIGRLATLCIAESGVDGVGVSVADATGHLISVHASDQLAAGIEDLQMTLGQGPCVDATSSGDAVLVPDLLHPADRVSRRWPVFVDEATRLGVRAVFAFPIRIGVISLGAVDLHREQPGPLDGSQLSAAYLAVDLLGREMLRTDNGPPADASRGFPASVHQAAGMVRVQLDTSIENALMQLRARAYAEERPLAELAADVVARRVRFGTDHS